MFSRLVLFLSGFLSLLLVLPIPVSAQYAFGLHTDENNTADLQAIEQQYGFHSDIVGYIYDSFTQKDAEHLKRSIETLGRDRVYHVTVSPMGLSARQVARGEYDEQYRRFFSVVKSSGAKVLFRTMHEMNGSWYSWSWDPDAYRMAWHHIYDLSREMGLTTEQILFVFSVNSEDLPSEDGSIWWKLMYCSPANKAKTPCLSFEDYFPGKNVVDIMGMTLYNWGRGRNDAWSRWKSFSEILENPTTQMHARLQRYQKPIFLDEVGTTAVDFSGAWSLQKLKNEYYDDFGRKDAWLQGFRRNLIDHPDIVGALYFNRDRATGFSELFTGELDWAVISIRQGKAYRAILDFFYDTHSTLSTLPFHPETQRVARTRIIQKKNLSSQSKK